MKTFKNNINLSNENRYKIFKYLSLFILITTFSTIADQKLKVYGHFTQAFAISDNRPALGISTNGTSDYRKLGLQFHFQIDANSVAAIMLKHRKMGNSPLGTPVGELEVDWGFYERNINNTTEIRVGRMFTPQGIYNEIRDVGSLLPLYYAPYSFYGENDRNPRTMDGILISNNMDIGNWQINWDLYGGKSETYQAAVSKNPFNNNELIEFVNKVDFNNFFGSQVWLTLPIEAARLGVTFITANLDGGLGFDENLWGVTRMQGFTASIDVTKHKWFFRSEFWQTIMTPVDFTTIGGYVQGSYRVLSETQLTAQYDISYIRNMPRSVSNFAELSRTNFPELENVIVGISQKLSNSLQLKAEVNFYKGYYYDDGLIDFFSGKPETSRLYIISLSSMF